MIDIFRERCFGCTACSSICPQKAISFEEDQLGFVYPVIDKTKCISCNLCEKRCPVQIYSSISHTLPKQVYAARHISLKEVKTSRSGAAFIALSDVVLKQGGTVFGASFVEGLKVKHIKTSNPHERDLLKGSKYVQSDMRGVIDEIIEELRAGNKVLFSGTPCQVAGLVSAVPKSLQTILYTLDIVCHGAPSPQLYKDYLTLLENKYGSKVLYFNFRDKSINGWHDHKESALLENGQKIVDKTYTNLFYTNCFFRDSCYACPFANNADSL